MFAGGDEVDLRICRQYSTSCDAGGLLINANTQRSNSHASCQHSSSSNLVATMVSEKARLVPILEPQNLEPGTLGLKPGTRTRNQNLEPGTWNLGDLAILPSWDLPPSTSPAYSTTTTKTPKRSFSHRCWRSTTRISSGSPRAEASPPPTHMRCAWRSTPCSKKTYASRPLTAAARIS